MKDKLIKIGFSEKEAAVYLTLLKIGSSSSSSLARLTGIKRTSIYDITSSLLEKDLILSYKQGKTTFFVIDDVNKIYFYEKEKAEHAKQLLSELKALKGSGEGIQINYYRGVEGYREMYEDILRANPKEFFGWIHLDYFYKALDMKREAQWTKERIQKKIRVRLIMEDTPQGRAYKEQDSNSLRETRLIRSKEPFKTTCLLYSDYIVFFDPTNEMTGIRIQSAELFTMEKAIFETQWAGLKIEWA